MKGIHIDQNLIEQGVYQTTKAHPVVRGGGLAEYFEIGPDQRFLMPRPGFPR